MAHRTRASSLNAAGHSRRSSSRVFSAAPEGSPKEVTSAPVAAAAAAAMDPAQEALLKEKRKQLLRGCKTVVIELAGLDFSRTDCTRYFAAVVKPPKGISPDFNQARAIVVLQNILAGVEEEAMGGDLEAMKVTELLLSEVWRWRRRGGGIQSDEGGYPYQLALEQIQNYVAPDMDKVTSSLLDNLPISDDQKRELGQGVQQVAIAGIGGAVWGSLVAGLLVLVAFNALRG
ncbi:MAG: hypothetical protein WDW36_000067 [Sanguina aurantia]